MMIFEVLRSDKYLRCSAQLEKLNTTETELFTSIVDLHLDWRSPRFKSSTEILEVKSKSLPDIPYFSGKYVKIGNAQSPNLQYWCQVKQYLTYLRLLFWSLNTRHIWKKKFFRGRKWQIVFPVLMSDYMYVVYEILCTHLIQKIIKIFLHLEN